MKGKKFLLLTLLGLMLLVVAGCVAPAPEAAPADGGEEAGEENNECRTGADKMNLANHRVHLERHLEHTRQGAHQEHPHAT